MELMEPSVESQVYNQQMMQQTANKNATTPFPSQDPSFMQWLFSFREQTVEPLKHLWRGEELDENGAWKSSKFHTRIMNEQGINWAISYIESFLSPVYVTSNYDENLMNYTMKETTRTIFNSLCLRYQEFELKKSDIERVGIEIESKILSILLGARGNGYRNFFSSTTHSIETTSRQEALKKPGIISGFLNRESQSTRPNIFGR
jgi:hypothetical protein